MSLLLLDADALGALVVAQITDDFTAAAQVKEGIPFMVAAELSGDFTASAHVAGGAVFIPPDAGDAPRIAVVTHFD